MALKTLPSHHPRPAPARAGRPQPPVEGRAGQDAGRGQDQVGRPQQPRPHHHAPHRRRPQAGLSPGRLPAHASSTCRPKVERLEYDPNRTAFIALLKYEDGKLAYILAPQRLAVGDRVVAGVKVDVKPGNAMPLASMPIGTIVHNVELKAGGGGQIARSAGAYVQLVGRDAGWAILRLNSGETRRVRAECMATVGAVSNPDHMNSSTGKAGRTRWQGTRPTVRSIAMNPVDHPNGGRTKGGKHWATPWGKPTKGYKTRKNKATDKFIVRPRSKAK